MLLFIYCVNNSEKLISEILEKRQQYQLSAI
jgi:hypothetical protein